MDFPQPLFSALLMLIKIGTFILKKSLACEEISKDFSIN